MPDFSTSRITKSNMPNKLLNLETLFFLLFRTILLHPGPLCNCGLLKIRLVRTYDLPWMSFFWVSSVNCAFNVRKFLSDFLCLIQGKKDKSLKGFSVNIHDIKLDVFQKFNKCLKFQIEILDKKTQKTKRQTRIDRARTILNFDFW